MLSAAVCSLIIIVLAHCIFAFLRDTLTVPRVRDLAVGPVAEREKLKAIAAEVRPAPPSAPRPTQPPETVDQAKMRNELRTFMCELKREGHARPPGEKNLARGR